ncbi:MAG: hypothetical protein JWM87_3686 [Candidatus Eremiobacteraeota bacterium]|nr:hypothetical protein [Candidatus Eremiobacteraeota bacterium]
MNPVPAASCLRHVGLLRVAHKTIILVQPQAFPFAPRQAQGKL